MAERPWKQSVSGTVSIVAARLGLKLGARLAGGEFGAFAVQTLNGSPLVVKLLPPHPALRLTRVNQALELCGALRASGYPAPRYVDAGEVNGTVYTLQELAAGEVPERFTLRQAEQLLEVRHMHERAAPEADSTWGSDVLEALTDGNLAQFVDQSIVRRGGPIVAELADRLGELARNLPVEELRDRDVVHGDFHHRNVLADGGHIVAVFDWEAARIVDSRLDLMTLAFWCGRNAGELVAPEAARRVMHEVDTVVPGRLQGVFAGLLALRLIGFWVDLRPERLPMELETVQRFLEPYL
jgi:aminoglycoside phosphotransferase (APT) family kinase protein